MPSSRPSRQKATDSDNPQMTLRFPPIALAVAVLFTIAGVAAATMWGPGFLRGEYLDYPTRTRMLMVGMLFLVVIGPGLFAMGQQVIDVYSDRLESRILGTRKVLDRATLAFHRETSNGYIVRDARGSKIHVHRMMNGSKELRKMIRKKKLPERAP